ncbi:MAG: LLM class flavin-dependent oxidoreductase [Nitrososphaerota archaeon]|nr:LLM class flavin-dependent oxidoreductase [Nitrososphaerota archaeon]
MKTDEEPNAIGLGALSDYLQPDQMVNLAIEGEKNGFAHFWVAEHFSSGDAVAVLGALTRLTTRIKLASGVVGAATRHPALTALTFSNLNRLSNGRVILGLGTAVLAWMDQMGLNHEKPLLLLSEAFTIIRGLLDGEKVNFEGEYFKARNMQLKWGPAKPRVPIYLAGVGPRMVGLGVAKADGILLSAGSSLKYLREIRPAVSEGLKKREIPGKAALASFVFCSMGGDDSMAIDAALGILSRPGRAELLLEQGTYSPARLERLVAEAKQGRVDLAKAELTDEMIDQIVVRGTASRCEDELRAMVREGLDAPIVMPVCREPYLTMELGRRFSGGS